MHASQRAKDEHDAVLMLSFLCAHRSLVGGDRGDDELEEEGGDDFDEEGLPDASGGISCAQRKDVSENEEEEIRGESCACELAANVRNDLDTSPKIKVNSMPTQCRRHLTAHGCVNCVPTYFAYTARICRSDTPCFDTTNAHYPPGTNVSRFICILNGRVLLYDTRLHTNFVARMRGGRR